MASVDLNTRYKMFSHLFIYLSLAGYSITGHVRFKLLFSAGTYNLRLHTRVFDPLDTGDIINSRWGLFGGIL